MSSLRAATGQATISNDVPEGWEHVKETKRNGTIVECYANVIGQKFYKKEDLMRYINYAKERGLSIYEPDFQNSKSASCSNNKQKQKSEVCTKSEKRKDVETECAKALLDMSLENKDEVQCARSLLQLSLEKNFVSRASRRLAGVEPELKHDFFLDRALDYVHKEKPPLDQCLCKTILELLGLHLGHVLLCKCPGSKVLQERRFDAVHNIQRKEDCPYTGLSKKNPASKNSQQHDKMGSKSEVCPKSKKRKEIETHNEIECAKALLDMSLGNKDEVQRAMALLHMTVQMHVQKTLYRGHQEGLQVSNESYNMILF